MHAVNRHMCCFTFGFTLASASKLPDALRHSKLLAHASAIYHFVCHSLCMSIFSPFMPLRVHAHYSIR